MTSIRYSRRGKHGYVVEDNVYRPQRFWGVSEPIVEPPRALRQHELAALGIGMEGENHQNGRKTIIPPPPKPSPDS